MNQQSCQLHAHIEKAYVHVHSVNRILGGTVHSSRWNLKLQIEAVNQLHTRKLITGHLSFIIGVVISSQFFLKRGIWIC